MKTRCAEGHLRTVYALFSRGRKKEKRKKNILIPLEAALTLNTGSHFATQTFFRISWAFSWEKDKVYKVGLLLLMKKGISVQESSFYPQRLRPPIKLQQQEDVFLIKA